jgi:hypothetical protein
VIQTILSEFFARSCEFHPSFSSVFFFSCLLSHFSCIAVYHVYHRCYVYHCRYHHENLLAEYQPLPRKETSTENGYRTATTNWNNFITTLSHPPEFMPAMDSAVAILDEFATYMVRKAQKGDGEPYSLGFVLLVLSGVKEMLRKKFPLWTIWLSHTGWNMAQTYGWYDEIRYAVTKAVVSEAFDNRETIQYNTIQYL